MDNWLPLAALVTLEAAGLGLLVWLGLGQRRQPALAGSNAVQLLAAVLALAVVVALATSLASASR